MTIRLGFLTTHPIQYQVPLFRILEKCPDVELTVFYCMIPNQEQQGAGFGVSFQWDVPLLEGYHHVVLDNKATSPGVTHFRGCDTPNLHDVFRDQAIDVIIVNGWVVKSCLQALWACKRLGIPCLVRGEANDLRKRQWYKTLVHRQLIKQYAACLYIGEANKRFYLDHGVPASRLFFSPYCIENARFESTRGSEEIRARFNITPDDVCFLYSGKFEHKKHPFSLVEAMLYLKGTDRKCHLIMVGDGELRNKCEDFAKQHQLQVHFAGFVNQKEIPAYYGAADCLALTSDAGETWGLVVNEAMAAGRPAIVSDLVGCAQDLISTETGWVYQFGNQEELQRTMREAATSRTQLNRRSDACKSRVAVYSPERAVQGILEAASYVTSLRNSR